MNLRTVEWDSIRKFVQDAADEGYLSGRVLDYGCGKQPYRDIVVAAGSEYVPFDRAEFPANVSEEDVGDWPSASVPWDAILCNQIVQYIPNEYVGEGEEIAAHEMDGVWQLLENFAFLLRRRHGYLVMTYPTNWPEVEPADLRRFTKAGMDYLLTDAGFEIVKHERRAQVAVMIDQSAVMALGYGVVACA